MLSIFSYLYVRIQLLLEWGFAQISKDVKTKKKTISGKYHVIGIKLIFILEISLLREYF